MYEKVQRVMGANSSSVEHSIPKVQRGYVVSGIDKTSTYLPCDIQFPKKVTLTPNPGRALAAATDATKVALFTTVAGYVFDLDNLKAVADLDAWANGVDYEVDQIVSNGGKAYTCIKANTSDNTASTGNEPGVADNVSEDYWQEIDPKYFLKVTHTSPGVTDKVAQFAYEIVGY
jgi:Carbohydrate-binding module family 5/12